MSVCLACTPTLVRPPPSGSPLSLFQAALLSNRLVSSWWPARQVLEEAQERLLYAHKMKSTTCLCASTLALNAPRSLTLLCAPSSRSTAIVCISACMVRQNVTAEELLA